MLAAAGEPIRPAPPTIRQLQVAPAVRNLMRRMALVVVAVGRLLDVAILADGDTVAVTFVGVLAGTLLPVKAKKVMSTNTSATALVGLL